LKRLPDLPAHPDELAGNPRWELVLRIAASPQFAKSARLKEFLFYIAGRCLTDRADEITEPQIGFHVFERNAAYNPAEDNIVRVNARYLRNKLKEYFEGPGIEEPEVLEIPKGSYVPVFQARPSEPAAPEMTVPRPASSRTYLVWAPWVFAGILLIISTALWMEVRALRSAPVRSGPENLVGLFLLDSERHAQMVTADSSLVMFQRFVHRGVTVQEYSERKYLADLSTTLPDPDNLAYWEYLLARPYTSYADLSLYSHIVNVNPDATGRLTLRHARSLQSREFKEGNFLLAGSPRSNPWVALFEPQLNFRFEYQNGRVRNGIVNVKPRQGEGPYYLSQAPSDVSGEAYAIVSLIPNLGGNGRVMIIAGTTSEATEAAGEYALDPATPAALRGRFHLRDLRQIETFELLLRTNAIGGTAQGATLLADRVKLRR
jgi:hypothetical protein